jgi:hypothetical protein
VRRANRGFDRRSGQEYRDGRKLSRQIATGRRDLNEVNDGFEPDDFDFDFSEAAADCNGMIILRATFWHDSRIAMTR